MKAFDWVFDSNIYMTRALLIMKVIESQLLEATPSLVPF